MNIELFRYRLQQLVAEAILLDIELDLLEEAQSNEISKEYPFDQEWQEMVQKLLVWRYSI